MSHLRPGSDIPGRVRQASRPLAARGHRDPGPPARAAGRSHGPVGRCRGECARPGAGRQPRHPGHWHSVPGRRQSLRRTLRLRLAGGGSDSTAGDSESLGRVRVRPGPRVARWQSEWHWHQADWPRAVPCRAGPRPRRPRGQPGPAGPRRPADSEIALKPVTAASARDSTMMPRMPLA